jgi:ABC-2 type transport system ATP-binding protein
MGNKAGLNWDLSARQSFILLQKIYEIPNNAFTSRVDVLCDLLRVAHVLDTQVRKLSLGERMKLELIGALLHDPKILFLDEPTIGLDIDAKKNIRSFLKTLHAEGKTLVLTSHDMDDIAAVCKRAIVINHGSIIYDGAMSELKDKYSSTRYLKLQFDSVVPERAELERHGEIVKIEGLTLVMRVPQKQVMQIATDISKLHAVRDVTIEQVALEEIISDVFASSNSEL